MTKQFLSIKDAAEYLGVDYKTVYRLVRSGELPAGKIGGVYRIRQIDLEQFFERQKSRLVDGEWTPIGAGAIDLLKCGRCFRLIPTEDQIGGPCRRADDGCEEVLCQSCWAQYPDRACDAHRPTPADQLAAARNQLRAGQITLIVTALEARQREQAFIARFERKVRAIDRIRHPLDGQVYAVEDWDAIRRASDETAALMEHLHVGYLDKRVADRLPLNVALGFQIAGKANRAGLGLEAQVMSNLAAHARDGFDTQPATVEELQSRLQHAIEIAEADKAAVILGLASTSGWDKAALKMVSADVRGGSFTHRLVMPCLIDLLRGTVTYNTLDERLKPFAGLFTPVLAEEEIERIAHSIQETLLLRESVSLAEVMRDVPASEDLARQAFERLAHTGQYQVQEIERVGTVIVAKT
jgi:excisionase family DNA binding protein